MSEVFDSDAGEGWRFTWTDHRGFWDLEWLPHKEQWLRGFRSDNIGSWSRQVPDPPLEYPFNHDDARRIAKAHVADEEQRSA